MKVLLCPADEMGCGHYRMIYPGRVLQITSQLDISFTKKLPMKVTLDRRVIGLGEVDADVVVLQRPLARLLADAIPHLQARGIRVVVEVDDDFTCPHPNHPVRINTHPKASPESNWHHLVRACGLADVVTVTTPALAKRYGGRGNAVVLPNCVPESMLSMVPDAHDHLTVGWSGFAQMHPGDLETTKGGVQAALAGTDARFYTIGDPAGVRERLQLRDEPATSGPLKFSEYARSLKALDIGIVPLQDSQFNAAKSCLKGLEYAALGIPFVASPRPDYVRLAADGVGLIASDRRKDWSRQLKRLIESEDYRMELALRSVDVIEGKYTYEQQAWRWAEVWCG